MVESSLKFDEKNEHFREDILIPKKDAEVELRLKRFPRKEKKSMLQTEIKEQVDAWLKNDLIQDLDWTSTFKSVNSVNMMAVTNRFRYLFISYLNVVLCFNPDQIHKAFKEEIDLPSINSKYFLSKTDIIRHV